jgi:hypothetical protein
LRPALASVGVFFQRTLARELDDFVKVQLVKWEKMIKDAGIQPE